MPKLTPEEQRARHIEQYYERVESKDERRRQWEITQREPTSPYEWDIRQTACQLLRLKIDALDAGMRAARALDTRGMSAEDILHARRVAFFSETEDSQVESEIRERAQHLHLLLWKAGSRNLFLAYGGYQYSYAQLTYMPHPTRIAVHQL
jgi:hypothetical protein